MAGDLLIAAGPGEWRAAWVEDSAARELYVERGDTKPAGSRHLGRVVRIVAALDAAFIDIGDERPGFLPLRDARWDTLPAEGAPVVVEVRREAWQDKAPSLVGKPADAPAPPPGLDPPAQLFPAPGLAAALALRLPGTPRLVIAEDAAITPQLRAAFPQAELSTRSADAWPVDLDAAFESALAVSLGLPGGGSAHFEETRAATLIDVDTGTPARGSSRRAALAANRTAATLIARELRRRNIGGAVVIDFVGLDRRDHRAQVERTLGAALSGDPAKPQMLGWTRLGHFELVRPRRARSLADAMLEPGRRDKQPAVIAHEALRQLQREARALPAAAWRLRVAPAVATALRGPAADALRLLQARLARRVAIETVAGLEGFDIAPA
jgi:Ribonuclease G/E